MSTAKSILVLEGDAAAAGLIADACQTLAPGAWRVTHAQPESIVDGVLPPHVDAMPSVVIADAAMSRELAVPDRDYGILTLLLPDEQHLAAGLTTLGVDDVLIRVPGYLDQLPTAAAKIAARRGVSAVHAYEAERVAELRAMLELISDENRHLHELIERLETMALSDPMTGLANRRAMQGRLDEEFAASVREGHDVSMMMIDLDGLKTVNDQLGHAVGDELIMLAAKTLIDGSRRSDITCRVGGDEFVIILPRTKRANARPVAERLCETFKEHASEIAAQLRAKIGEESARCVGLSIGLASRIEDGSESGEELLARADVALYRAKGQRLGVAVFSENDGARGSGMKLRPRKDTPQPITHKAA